MTVDAPVDLVFVGDRCCDHSPSSGYDQICSIFPQAGWLSGRRLIEGDVVWHRRPERGDGCSRSVFHVFYGDCSGSALPGIIRARFPDATVVLTVHQPVSRMLGDRAAMAALRAADGILTVSETQAREIAELGLAASVRAVPHGVWTQAFRPALPSRAERHEVLFVGNYLRDWSATTRLVDMLAGAGLRSRIVGTNAPGHLFDGREFVSVAARLTERELADTYHRSAALLMPVHDATASNALLEAMSAGCPVVCSASPALVDEYVGDRVDAFGDGEHDVAVARLLRYVGEPRRREARSRTLMRRVQRFDWSNLAARYARAYEEIVDRTRDRGGPASDTQARSSTPVHRLD